jgi:hypothetical protein
MEEEGMVERFKKYDSRNGKVLNASRRIGHTTCTHTPRCISMANAKSATVPHTHPSTPGNESVYTGNN